jgi:hypothetical protein
MFANETADREAALRQRFDRVASDESGSARDKNGMNSEYSFGSRSQLVSETDRSLECGSGRNSRAVELNWLS